MIKTNKTGLYKSDKIITYSKAAEIIKKLKTKNRKIGLCHGGFDLLHPGHVMHFQSAKKLCDVLFVSVTSDRFVSMLKGKNRPIFTDKLRAYMISSIGCVDYVVISNHNSAVETINLLKPTFYIKGPDYTNSNFIQLAPEKKAAISAGGKIRYTSDPKLSTTRIIEYIKNKL